MRNVLKPVILMLLLAVCAIAADSDSDYDLSDPAGLILSADGNPGRFSWPLRHASARKMVIDFLAAGDAESALAAAGTQFALCPPGELQLAAAVASVSEALRALDGDSSRADAFPLFAEFGPAGPDATVGTSDDLENPLPGLVLLSVSPDEPTIEEVDAALDARMTLAEDSQRRWYLSAKAIARINRGDFNSGITMAASCLAEAIKHPAGNVDGQPEFQRNQDILDRVTAALSAGYRARTATYAGAEKFIDSCMEYVRLGPAGKDGWMETDDDLEAPL